MLQETWKRALADLENRLGPNEVESWFHHARLLHCDGQVARLSFPTEFHAHFIRQHYLPQLQASLGVPEAHLEVEQRNTEDILEEQGGAPALGGELELEAPASAPRIEALPLTPEPAEDLESSTLVLNPHYVFDNYVVGPCNTFAHAACRGVADRPASAFNPLFLHGPVGVGKTHLIQAIAHHLLARQHDLRIVSLSCEQFINHFIGALKQGDLDTFRNRYRLADVLVVDDIHLLANKARTQEEFFHTFNTLHNARKQIVLSSDSPPQDIPQLHERLVSRFKWGLVAEIEPPCFETRVAILQAKAQHNHVLLDDEVAKHLAEHVTNNVRELEGTLTRMLAMASLTNRKLDMTLAHEVLGSNTKPRARVIRIDDILQAVTGHFGVKVSDLQSKRRTQSIVVPRQAAMNLARKLTQLSLEEIGGFFGGRDHSTVVYAVERIENRCRVDSDFGSLMAELERQVRAGAEDG